MRLLFDHNLSYRLVAALARWYPDSSHLRAVGLASADDDLIWTYARQHALVIVSKGSDFFHRSVLFGHPPKVVWIRLGNCTTERVFALLRLRYADLLAFEQDDTNSFLALGMTDGLPGET